MNQIKHNNVSIIYVYYHCVLIISIFLALRLIRGGGWLGAGGFKCILEAARPLFHSSALWSLFSSLTHPHRVICMTMMLMMMMGGYKNVGRQRRRRNVTDRNGSFFFVHLLLFFPLSGMPREPRARKNGTNFPILKVCICAL